MADQHGIHLSDEDLHVLIDSLRKDPDGKSTTASDRLVEAQSHANSCNLCGSRLRRFLAVELELKKLPPSDRLPPPGDACPPAGKWASLAGGLQSSEESESLIQHAAQCDHCGYLLRQITEDFEAPISADEEQVLSGLSSNDKGWQRELAEKLRHSARPSIIQTSFPLYRWKLGFLFPRWALVGAAGAIVAVTCLWWFVVRQGNHSVDSLLATAYSQHRTLELRIPGAQFGAIRSVRGTGESHLERPPALLQAESIIAEKLAYSPDSAVWLQAKGRAEILEENYSSAIKSLRRAEELQPGLSELNVDLAAAYFQRAESEDKKADFGNAVELLSRELAHHPENKTALFNHAIALERMGLYAQAIEDWQRYLRLDPYGLWSREAQERLANVQKKLQSSKEKSGPLLPATELARLLNTDRQHADQLVDQRIEEYQELAVDEWLPALFDAKSRLTVTNKEAVQTALAFVANVSASKHRDDWLRDLLNISSSTQLAGGILALRNAVLASKIGQYDVALNEASTAEKLFRKIGSDAGIFRARYEKSFAFQFSALPRTCAAYAGQTDEALTAKATLRYPRLRALLGIETGICQNLADDFGAARLTLSAASSLAEASSYRLTYLRAQTMIATVLWSEGKEDAAWNILAEGVDRCVAVACPPMRVYSFYANMDEFAEDDRQTFLQVLAAEEAVQTIAGDDDHLIRALEHNRLARAAWNAGLEQKAALNFEIAHRLMSSVTPSDFSKNYETEIAVNLAQLAADRGDSASAMRELLRLQPAVLKNADPYLKVDYFQTLATLQVRSADLEQAKNSLERASAFSVHQSCSLATTNEHLNWRKRSAQTYRALVAVDLQRGAPLDALERWEWYLAAAPCTPTDRISSADVTRETVDGRPPPLPLPHQVAAALPNLQNVTFLSYAVLPKQIAIWAYDNRGVFEFNSPVNSDDLARLGAQFNRLCSDPTTDIQRIDALSHQLYSLLFGPVESHLDSSRVLIVDGDDEVTGLPLQALRVPRGPYLADIYTIVYSSGLYGWRATHRATALKSTVPALVVGFRGGHDAVLRNFTPLQDVSVETQFVTQVFTNSVLLEDAAATLVNVEREIDGAFVFHYAGHGLVLHQRVGLLLASADVKGPVLLDASDLQPALLKRMQLAVLSACATGGSDTAEGLGQPYSLARAFLDAGVPHVVASRWDVDSAATLRFMNLFYGAIQNGAQIPEALGEASRAIRVADGRNHPYYWAAFSAFGKV